MTKTFLHHPFTWFRKPRLKRQRLAFMYQILRQALSGRKFFGLRLLITFGELLTGKTTLADIEDVARRTLTKHIGAQEQPNLFK